MGQVLNSDDAFSSSFMNKNVAREFRIYDQNTCKMPPNETYLTPLLREPFRSPWYV